MRNLFALGLLSSLIFGCSNRDAEINDTEEDTTVPSDLDDTENQDDTQPPESLFNPDLVFFYSTVVVDNENDIGCFDDGDSTPYCGVFRYMMVDFENWEGVDDMANACHIIHKIDPSFVVETSPVVETDWNGWTIEAAQSHVENSAMCNFINEETEAGLLVNQLSTTDFRFGIGPVNPDAYDSYEEFVVESQSQEVWDSGFKPYILSQSISVGNLEAQPNFMYVVERDETGQPVVVDNSYQILEVEDMDSLVPAWYRARTWYGYNLDKF